MQPKMSPLSYKRYAKLKDHGICFPLAEGFTNSFLHHKKTCTLFGQLVP